MKKTIEYTICDICGKEADTENINYPVLFTTEQTDGRACKPYVSQQKLDVCADCMGKIIKLTATGAQGCNTYRVREGDRWKN